jgi:predicted kinase
MAKVFPTKPFLIMLYGFPGAGKTYFSRQFCENIQAAHVQADRVRNELFEEPRYDKQENEVVNQLMEYMTEEFLSAGLSVVYDVNAVRAGQRHMLRELAKKHHATPVVVWFQMDVESAFYRAIKRDRRKADDKYSRQLDRTTFDALVGQMQNPTMAEDYAVISGKHVYPTQQSAVMSKLRDKGVLNLDDASSHIVKPGMVNLVPASNQQLPNGGRVDMTRRNITIR